jgi:hypothetical protein
MAHMEWATRVLQRLCTKTYAKPNLSTDGFLKLGNLKKELPVIVDQHATVKLVNLSWVRIARPALKVECTGKLESYSIYTYFGQLWVTFLFLNIYYLTVTYIKIIFWL